jgi:hypothetical protein
VQSVNYHGDGKLGRERKLQNREMAARFGHHIALVWNMGEEIANDKDECEVKDREEPENSVQGHGRDDSRIL